MAYNLFGRQIYPGANQYEYYITREINNTYKKYKNGNNELQDNQVMDIPGMNSDNGPCIIKLYDYDIPRYNP